MLYSIITVASIVLNIPFAKYAIKRFEEEGYTYSNNKPLSHKVYNILRYSLLFLVPILHALVALSGVMSIKDDDTKEEFYQALKKRFVKDGVIVNKNTTNKKVVKPVTTEETNNTKVEEPIRTYQDARSYWYSQHESQCPTLPTMDEINNSEENERGYQKTIGTRKY